MHTSIQFYRNLTTSSTLKIYDTRGIQLSLFIFVGGVCNPDYLSRIGSRVAKITKILGKIRQLNASVYDTTVLRRTPTPSISTSTTSPDFKAVVVPGVPVNTASPGSKVIACEMKLTITGTGKIRSPVV